MSDELDSIQKNDIEKLLSNLGNPISIGKLIGKGGQKHVYRAIDKNDESEVVFKILKPSKNTLERVKREIRAINLIDHPNIPRIIKTNITEVTEPKDLIWIIEEFIDGISLREALSRGRIFNYKDILSFFDTMLSILMKSESMAIVHRDIKPENIILDKNEKLWLIDFGISRHLDLESITSTNSPVGPHTLGYSASEQFRNRKKDVDIRADLFSLGVVSAEMILGKNPYWENTHSVLQLIKKIDQQPLPILRIEGDSQFLLAKFIKTLGDNRVSRRPSNVTDAIRIFKIVKESLK